MSSWETIRTWFRKYLSQVLIFLGGLALYILFGLFLWWLLQLYVEPGSIKDPSKEATAKKDLLQALAFIMAGVAGAIGIYFTWRGQRLTQESTREELRITREGQITERFMQAIDQLGKVSEKGNKLLEIRLGGIYALERIARYSPVSSDLSKDYEAVMEVLTAYVRENAPWPPRLSEGSSEADGGTQQPAPPDLRRPSADIQAILDVLGRRVAKEYLEFGDEGLVRLTGLTLYEARIVRANLERTEALIRFDLHETNLQNSTLASAYLKGVNLKGANLEGTNLKGANLEGADLKGANLGRANLSEANLYGADLSEAQHLIQEQLEQAEGDENTELPLGLKPPAHWGENTDLHPAED